jgi:hypothetical protein
LLWMVEDAYVQQADEYHQPLLNAKTTKNSPYRATFSVSQSTVAIATEIICVDQVRQQRKNCVNHFLGVWGIYVSSLITPLIDGEPISLYVVVFNTIPTGQWSEPVISGIINAFETAGSRFSVTKK